MKIYVLQENVGDSCYDSNIIGIYENLESAISKATTKCQYSFEKGPFDKEEYLQIIAKENGCRFFGETEIYLHIMELEK